MLRLREGWEKENDRSGFEVYKRKGADSLMAYVIVDPEASIFAYPFGAFGAFGAFGEFGLYSGRKVKTLDEAHAYLLGAGSESPWEVTP